MSPKVNFARTPDHRGSMPHRAPGALSAWMQEARTTVSTTVHAVSTGVKSNLGIRRLALSRSVAAMDEKVQAEH